MIIFLFADIRNDHSDFYRHQIDWHSGITALETIKLTLSKEMANQIIEDIERDSPEITISWNEMITGEHSDIGGVDSLDWEITDNSILTVTYENNATSEEQIDKLIAWMLQESELTD